MEDVSVSKIALYSSVGLVALLGVIAIPSSFYTVSQNEVGAVTRFGKLVSITPENPGLHFKLPFADTAHTIQTSIGKLPIDNVAVKTIDNQFVTVNLNLTYRVSDPFKALFQVGDMGNKGVHDKIVPFVQSRALDVFGKINALEIENNKQAIEVDILKDVQSRVQELFGELIEDIQITNIQYDKSFEANIQETVKTRNQQISAQNLLKVRQTEAETNVAIADGEKRVAMEKADGEAYAVKTKAIAEAEAKKAIGDADAHVISVKVNAAGNPAAYASILTAEALKNWNGSVPQYQLGGNSSGVAPVLMIPNGTK